MAAFSLTLGLLTLSKRTLSHSVLLLVVKQASSILSCCPNKPEPDASAGRIELQLRSCPAAFGRDDVCQRGQQHIAGIETNGIGGGARGALAIQDIDTQFIMVFSCGQSLCQSLDQRCSAPRKAYVGTIGGFRSEEAGLRIPRACYTRRYQLSSSLSRSLASPNPLAYPTRSWRSQHLPECVVPDHKFLGASLMLVTATLSVWFDCKLPSLTVTLTT